MSTDDQKKPKKTKQERQEQNKKLAGEAASFAAGLIPGGKIASGAAGKAAGGAAGAAAKGAAGAAGKAGAGQVAKDAAKKGAKDLRGAAGSKLRESGRGLADSLNADAKRSVAAQKSSTGDAGAELIEGAKAKTDAMKAEAKDTAKSIGKDTLSGAAQGATKGGWVGAAVGAGVGVLTGTVKSKGGRKFLIGALVLLLLPGIIFGGVATLSVLMSVAMTSAQNANSSDVANESGAEKSAISAAMSQSGAVPWTLWLWAQENKPEIEYTDLASALKASFSGVENPTLLMGAGYDSSNRYLMLGEGEADKKKQTENERMVAEALLSLKSDPDAADLPTEYDPAKAGSGGGTKAAPPAASGKDITSATSNTVLVNKTTPLNPADYAPSDLVAISSVGVPSANGHSMRAEPAGKLKEMADAAKADGHTLDGTSAYRDYALQTELYNADVAANGQEAADKQTAKPGTSEHQTGLAVDISAAGVGCALEECFGDTDAGKWLAEHSWEYGFILRYAQGATGTTGYDYEPWHFRYIGVADAKAYHEAKATTLESYLGASAPAAPSAPAGEPRPGYHFTQVEAKTAFQLARSWAMGQGGTCGADDLAAPEAINNGTATAVDGVEWPATAMGNATAIVGATKGYLAGQPEATIKRAGIVTIATAMQESTLENIGYGDWETSGVTNPDGSRTTSLGLFQQQDSWGTKEQRLTPTWTTAKFLSVLATIPGWESMKLSDAAWEVQIYAREHAAQYDKWEKSATLMWELLKNTPAVGAPSDLASYDEQVAPGGGAGGTLASGDGKLCEQSTEGMITGTGGLPIDPTSGAQFTDFYGDRACGGCSSFHEGVDIGAPEGTPIFAVADGEVIESDFGGCVGNSVGIFHEAANMTTTYWHQATLPMVKVGDKVKAGQQIGVVGNTGSCSQGAHLHLNFHDGRETNMARRNPIPVFIAWGVAICEAYPISGGSSKQTCG